MKLVLLSALLISCLASSSVLSAQESLLQSETQKLVNSLREDISLSSEQKIEKYKVFLQKENTKSDLNNLTILILNEAIVTEMGKIGDYAEVKALFETSGFLKDINKTNENVHFYVNFLRTTADAYLKLQEYDSAKKVIAELQYYLSLYEVTDETEAHVLMLIGQFHVMKGEYKEGLEKFKLTMQLVGESSSFSNINKLKKISSALSYIGNTYHMLGDYKNAIKYYESAIDKASNSLDAIYILVYKHNIASSHIELLEWQEALDTATFASQQAKETNRTIYFAKSNEVIARAQHGLGKSVEAIKMIRTSIDTYKKNNYTQKVIEALAYEAEFHISLGHWDKAREKTTEAHSILDNAKNQAKPTIALFKSSFLIEEQNKNAAKALFYQKQLITLKDKDFQNKKEQDTQWLMLNFELDLAEERSLRLEQENKLKSALIERNQSQNKFLMSVITGTIIVLILLLYVSIRERSLKLKMSRLAMTDDLTGCPNRRNAMYQAKVMLSNQVNKKDSMIIAILDVDNFKAINDTYGHDIGDKALQNLTLIVTEALRETDVMGRYGGEEFIILLPNAGEKEIRMIFSRIQSALKNHICEYHGEIIALPITVSIGAAIVSHVPDELAEKEQKLLLHNIIKKADNKTYEAKEEGKDQLKLDTLCDLT
jgi:diguanylate cyclase (GGDEF)-like protein